MLKESAEARIGNAAFYGITATACATLSISATGAPQPPLSLFSTLHPYDACIGSVLKLFLCSLSLFIFQNT